jgi:ATP-dependent phosphofructokinase / diphosphate-dependent phosphofructokinase
MTATRTIGLLTGGGDCPGLNAVIRACVLAAARRGIRVLGIEDGYLGLIEGRARELGPSDVREILAVGGTILGTSNRADPFRYHAGDPPAATDVSADCLRTLERRGIEALIVVGGDGSLGLAQRLAGLGVNCIGIPKTIDNDVRGTDLSFGFMTAVTTSIDALDRLKTTAASHGRVIVMEVMGRHAGWIALYAGIGAGADLILMPEVPFDTGRVCEAISRARAQGRRSAVICIAEGAAPRGGHVSISQIVPGAPEPLRLGGISQRIAAEIESQTGIESRYVVLGHVQRGGSPVAIDRILASHFGVRGMDLIASGARNRMVAWNGGTLADVDLRVPASGQRLVTPDEPLVHAARELGISFGDEGP